jgi:transcriptional regulator with XRE-family HTH domain
METTGNGPRNGARPAVRASIRASVNDDIRRVSSNLALAINHCGLSQSELSRRSGLSRQLINGWARERGSVSLSATVGQLLGVIKLTLADLLLDQELLSRKLRAPPRADTDLSRILPQLARSLDDESTRQRIAAMAGIFRSRSRLKETPTIVLERRFEIVPDGVSCAVNVFESSGGNEPFARGNCFYQQSTFFMFAACTDPPHRPLIYAFRDPQTATIMSLNGVSIVPHSIGPDTGSPLTQLVYLSRDGAPASAEFDPEREFNSFIPADACTVLTTF